MKLVLFGAQADALRKEIEKHPGLKLVTTEPDVVVCYGGDGTLLAAELRWPGVPKAPIKNSRRGIRCMPHPPADVIQRLAAGKLVRTEYIKLECTMRRSGQPDPPRRLTAMNEFNVHMGRINSAVRYKLWINDDPFHGGQEIIGDGFVISTPFGSTAYFNHITRGVFHLGIGIAFKAPIEQTSHIIVPEDAVFRVAVTRGPAVLAFDNSPDYFDLGKDDQLIVRKSDQPATILTWHVMTHPSDEF